MKNIKFSVIIPLYNCEKFIIPCINSLLEQDYPDFEIVVVNDGSTDQSKEKVLSLSDERIHLISQKNQGLFHARIAGLKAASYEYCLFLDADDLLQKNTLGTLARFFQTGVECIIYKTQQFFGESPKQCEEDKGTFPDQTEFNNEKTDFLLEMLITTGKVNSIVCKAFMKNLIDVEKLSRYPRINIGEDALFSLDLLSKSHRSVYLDRPFYYYRQHENSMSHKMTEQYFQDNIFRFQKYFEEIDNRFSGNSSLYFKVDHLVIHMVLSLALNWRYKEASYSDYKRILTIVNQDTLFQTVLNRSFEKQNVTVKIILFFLKKKLYFCLFILKKIIACFEKLNRLCKGLLSQMKTKEEE